MNAESARILIVDDEPAMRAMAKAMLEAQGHETVLANSGEQAVDLYHQSLLDEQSRITMAIMDLTLPGGMSGVEALQELQEMDEELPVVATSGYLEENAYDICQQIGFVGVLPKPYTAEKLRHLVSWVISRRGIPGGYDEGMPRPEKPKKQEKPVEKPAGENTPAPGVDQVSDTADADHMGLESADAHVSKLQPTSGVHEDAAEAEIADRLTDLVGVAVAHRGREVSPGESETHDA